MTERIGFYNRPGLGDAHHALLNVVIRDSSALSAMHEIGLIKFSDYRVDGVPLARTAEDASQWWQAQHKSGHEVVADWQRDTFSKDLDRRFNDRVADLSGSGLSVVEAQRKAAGEFFGEVRGHMESLRTRVNPLIADVNGKIEFVDFAGNVLDKETVRTNGWYTPLYNEDPILKQVYGLEGPNALNDYYGRPASTTSPWAVSTETWKNQPDYKWGSAGISLSEIGDTHNFRARGGP